jgi:hypothetical protein
MWRSIMHKRHKIDLNDTFSEDSMWERLKGKVLSTNKNNTKRKSKSKRNKSTGKRNNTKKK